MSIKSSAYPNMPENPKTNFQLINELIIAVSQLLWPLVTLTVILLFRKELSDVLKRIKRGKILGQEVELENRIEEFKEATTKATEDVVQEDTRKGSNGDVINTILAKSIEDPKIGILLLSQEIERESINLIASMGLLNELKVQTVKNAFELLERHKYLPTSLIHSVRIFWELRNKIIHGKQFEDERQIIRVLDIGALLLSTLMAIPHEKHFVQRVNIDLYADSECITKRPEILGIVLESISTKDSKKICRIFPTPKRNYAIGSEVSWEWNLLQTWGKTWYKDPETNEIKSAWHSAAEFVGRPIEDIL